MSAEAAHALILHGGAWAIPDDEVAAHEAGLRRALETGWSLLESGASALDIVESVVCVLEDDGAFDAGRGSVLSRDGFIEVDAAIMDGESLRCGAVGAVRGIKNPVRVARKLLAEDDVHFLVGEGAREFATESGIGLVPQSEIETPRERARFERSQRLGHRMRESFEGPKGTVGALARDRAGRLAAASSTGGTPFKRSGRVGDTAVIGAGIYADGTRGAAASTGFGEGVIRFGLARAVTDGLVPSASPPTVAGAAIDAILRRVNGRAGVIALDAGGRPAFAFNTPRMAVAFRTSRGASLVEVAASGGATRSGP